MDTYVIYYAELCEARACGVRDFPSYKEWLRKLTLTRRYTMSRHNDEQEYHVDSFDLEADQKRYDNLEYKLYTIANDLSNTCKDMNKVQAETSEHFHMPMHLLCEIMGLCAQAIDKHSLIKKENCNDL